MRISIDPHCTGREYPGGYEIRTPEMTMFEDMASLFNMAREAQAGIIAGQKTSKAERKRAFALYRSVVSAAFYFIESFMNGLAADYVWQHRAELSANELMLLTEWNHVKNHQRPVTTREKLVKYPRIMTGSEYPPLHEDNCEELKFISESHPHRHNKKRRLLRLAAGSLPTIDHQVVTQNEMRAWAVLGE